MPEKCIDFLKNEKIFRSRDSVVLIKCNPVGLKTFWTGLASSYFVTTKYRCKSEVSGVGTPRCI